MKEFGIILGLKKNNMIEKEYVCGNCEVEMDIFDIGILASLEYECFFTTKMICLCKSCTIEREKELKKELELIQSAIRQNIRNLE
jgi:hypothetical protein